MYKAVAAIVFAISAVSVPVFAQDAQQGTEQKQEEPKKVEPVDFRKLKALLPEKVGEIQRSNAKGEKSGFGEMKISQATGEYTKDESESSATLTIMDYGAIPGAAAGLAAWEQTDIDNESDDEYTKTVKIGDYKALETYNNKDKRGSIQLLVAKRFMVNLEIHNMDAAELEKTISEMKLADLAALAK